jgi:hypothetical protein
MAMAKAKKPAAIVFGMGDPVEDDMGDADASHDEASETLKAALADSGIDASDALMDALHQYVEACLKKPPEPMASEEEDY